MISFRFASIALPAVIAILVLLAAPSCGQVVQLPGYHHFSYGGTVTVPDGGSMMLGGAGTSASSRVVRGSGPVTNGASGLSTSSQSVAISAEVIDLQALDNAILSANLPIDEAMKSGTSANSPASGGRRRVVSNIPPRALSKRLILPPEPNAWQAELRGHGERPPIDESLVESNIRYYLAKGREAELAGHINASRVFYQLALDAMTPEIKQRYQMILEKRKADEEAKRKQMLQSRARF